MRIGIFVVVFFLAFSCEKEITLELTENNPKLVVNCLFSPDTNFRVFVSQTQQINSQEDLYVSDAEVSLFKDGVFLEYLTYSGTGWFESSIYPEYNSIYQLQVITNSDSVYAQSYVPKPVVNYSGSYQLVNDQSLNNSQPSYEIKYIYYFDDGPESNYYHILEGNLLQSSENYAHITDPSILEDSEIKYNPGSLFFSDNYFNGGSAEVIANIIHFGGLGGQPGSFFGQIKSVSVEYFEFMRSWVKHKFNQNTDTNIDDPLTLIFQGEPTDLYSNIVGGYGIFAGYSRSETEFLYIP